MKSWLRIFIVILSVTAMHLVADAGAIDRLRSKMDQSRGIASVKKKKLKPRGLYIPQKALRALSHNDRMGYYLSFSEFIKDFNFSMRKNKKYSQILPMRSPYEEIFFPRTDAALCSSSGWIVDNGKSACNSASNWWFNVTDSPDWNKYKPVHLSYDHCGNRQPCPVAGVEVHNGQLRGMCGDSKGTSTVCTNAIDNGGARTLEAAFERCEKDGTTGYSNISCPQLRDDFQKTLAMYNTECNGASGVAQTACGRLKTAVQSVAAKINEVVNPGDPDKPANQYLPNQASCNALDKDITNSMGSDAKSSKDWDALLSMASTNCRQLIGKDKNAAALLYGKCDTNLGGKNESQLRELMTDFSRRKRDPEYGKAFVQAFGMTPGIFERYFCGAANHIDFSERLKRFNESVPSTRKWLIENTAYHERSSSAPRMSEDKFNDFKRFMMTNEDSIGQLANSIKGNDDLSDVLRSARVTAERYKSQVTAKLEQLYGQLESDPSLSRDLNKYFNDNLFSKESSSHLRLGMMMAVSHALQDKLLDPNHASRTSAAVENMNKCSEKITVDSDPQTSPAGTWTGRESNYSGCRYIKETDLRGYNNADPKKSPYVIFDREGGANGERGACLKQDTNYNLPPVTISSPSGGTYSVQQIKVFNPLRPDSVRQTIQLDAGSFDRTPNGTAPLKRYVLYKYTCDNQTAEVDFSDVLDLGAETDY